MAYDRSFPQCRSAAEHHTGQDQESPSDLCQMRLLHPAQKGEETCEKRLEINVESDRSASYHRDRKEIQQVDQKCPNP